MRFTTVFGVRSCGGRLPAGWRRATTGFGSARTVPGLVKGTPRLTARFADGIAGIGPDMLVVARVFKAAASEGEPRKAEGEPVAIIPLAPVPGQPRTFAANAPALAAGRYLVRLDTGHVVDPLKAGAGSPPEATLEIVPAQTSELVELSAGAIRWIDWQPPPAAGFSRPQRPTISPESSRAKRSRRHTARRQPCGIAPGLSGSSSAFSLSSGCCEASGFAMNKCRSGFPA